MDDDSGQQGPPPGWYPDPHMADTKRYWDGTRWSDHIAPVETDAAGKQNSRLIGAGLVVATVIGLVMAGQSASLLSGTGLQWTGAVLAVGAAVVSVVMRRTVSTGVIVATIILAVLAVISVIYLEVELEQKRQELGNLFGS